MVRWVPSEGEPGKDLALVGDRSDDLREIGATGAEGVLHQSLAGLADGDDVDRDVQKIEGVVERFGDGLRRDRLGFSA